MHLWLVVVGLFISSLTMAGPIAPSLLEQWSGKSLALHASVHYQPAQNQETSSTPRWSATTTLQKRMFDLQIHRVKIYQMAVPIQLAYTQLSNFYFSVLLACSTNWVKLPPQDVLRIVQGPFQMTLRSTGGTIPWSLIGEIAFNMQAVTVLGFTGTYDLLYTDNQSAGVIVEFRILPIIPG